MLDTNARSQFYKATGPGGHRSKLQSLLLSTYNRLIDLTAWLSTVYRMQRFND